MELAETVKTQTEVDKLIADIKKQNEIMKIALRCSFPYFLRYEPEDDKDYKQCKKIADSIKQILDSFKS